MQTYLKANIKVATKGLPKPKDLTNLIGDEIHYKNGMLRPEHTL